MAHASVTHARRELVVEIVRQRQRADAAADVAFWCNLLTEPLESRQHCVRETTIVSIGALGKIGDDTPLLTSLRCLIVQLREKNILLRGLAHLQLRNLAAYRKKSFYNIISPFLPEISCLVVSKLKAAPLMLVEFCQLLGLKPADFLTQTLQHTLPGLVHDLDAGTLEKLSADLGRSLPTLIVSNAHMILTRAFLSNNTDIVFEFILALLHQDANPKAQVKGDTFVRSCVLALVCELVCCLGDTDQMEGRDAISALEKVQRKIAPSTSKRSTTTVSTFLRPYLLGIMTHFNDLLHDLRGRKTVQDKNMFIRSLGSFFVIIGPPVYQVAHQSMALLQSTIKIHALGEASIGAWYKFILALLPVDIGPYVGPLSAAVVTAWPHLSPSAQQLARQTLEHCIVANAAHVKSHVDKIVDLSDIPLLAKCAGNIAQIRAPWSTRDTMEYLLQRCAGENLAVTTQSLLELQKYIKTQGQQFLNAFASGDVFDPLVSRIVDVLLAAAALDGEDAEPVHLIAFEILGMLGALDPDRFESQTRENTYTLLKNFDDFTESAEFAIHLIEELLVPAFRSTSDPRFQTTTGFAIQELSKFCGFTVDLDRADGKAIKQSTRKLWNDLTQTARDTVAPFRGAKFVVQEKERAVVESFPIYPSQASYRDWLQTWAAHLLSRVSSPAAKSVFSSCRGALRGNDARVALFLIPHLVLHILISGTDQDRDTIRQEIVVILEDLVTPTSGASADRRTLSAQMIFTLLDHLNRWVRYARQSAASANDSRRRKPGSHTAVTHLATTLEERVLSVHSVLSSIDRALMARAAFQCKAYARALMNLEQQILERRQLNIADSALKDHYERLHEIYCLVDEPDGMEGVSTLILSPSMEAQIRQHESTGRWTAAQSCWEVQLQQSPNELSLHAGLLRCLRNLGHYDTLQTHIQGVLTRNPEWKDDLAGFELESAWIVRDWDRVEAVAQDVVAQTAENTMARLLLALRTEDEDSKRAALASSRLHLGAPVTGGGRGSYRRSYDAVMNLHVVHELELIQEEFRGGRAYEPSSQVLPELTRRFDAVLPTFRTHESLLNMRRTAFGLRCAPESFARAIGKSWLLSARIARKAGHYQTAYSALLQASQNGAAFAFIQNCKLTKDNGDAIKALNELTAELAKYKGATGEDQLDPAIQRLTVDDKQQLAKAMVLRARWMQDTTRFSYNDIYKQFSAALEVCQGWESAYFHLGHYQDEWQRHISEADRISPIMIMNIVQNYALSLQYGSKNIYQTMPRMLTLWLDLGEEKGVLLAEKEGKSEAYGPMNNVIKRAMDNLAVYKWFTAFPQIVSRVDHPNKTIAALLAGLISKVIIAFPQQGLWYLMAVKNSKTHSREKRGKGILQQLQNRRDTDLNELIKLADQMTEKLIELCDFAVGPEPLTISGKFPQLIEYTRAPVKLILPLQESLTTTLPPRGAVEAEHQPFPLDLPLICGFEDEIDIMRSMQKPRRITIIGQNGQKHMMMAKPRDDLRKDARLMDFNTIINKLLKTKSESRRRQLHIRTYSVVTLNEECGLLQWVPNTMPIRTVLCKLYDPRGINCLGISALQAKLKELAKDPAKDAEAAKIFTTQFLPLVPPVMHEWFLDSFPDPSAWLASRTAYSRTTAVISMVGYVLGLGDRHSENILIDQATGDIVHVDFNMLFEKGKFLDMPERVPFRLTQNIVDGMGITGTEGAYRIACELVMKLLRDYKDCLMNVLEAFIHDPLVEWDEEKKRRERALARDRRVPNLPKADRVDVKALAKTALHLIHRKLSGMQAPNDPTNERIISTSDQVAALISEAIDPKNLGRMYQGWAPHL
ncbi:hypothetical protein AURDEDRAFT_53550 [Auricularia subglabra TFB-10046 SS5]|nr:hypothetical protein AURDEDRAFT_53550 [Auricularia subglabra TFB-10046 SS5]